MVQSLQALAEQTSNKVMRDVIRDVCTRVEGGDNFSAALNKHPKVFDRLYVCMVDAGEKGGYSPKFSRVWPRISRTPPGCARR